MTQRKTGGINYTKAVTHGMPAGRGRKPNEKPRKRAKKNHPSSDDLIVLPRTSLEPSNFIPQREAARIIPPTPVSLPHPVQTALSPSQPSLCVPHSYDDVSQPQQFHSFPATVSGPLTYNNALPGVHPAYPSPNPGTFLVYLLCYCPNQTSICFSCRRMLKPSGIIGNPPADLVIVSNMVRQWSQGGLVHSKPGNVYFHCLSTCVQQWQPYFRPSLCVIPCQTMQFLRSEHWVYLRQSLGDLQIV